MTTDKQIESNRRNALKSTGPRTAEGKLRSARNGPNHQRLSRAVVLETESAHTFRYFEGWFITEYNPDGPTQTMLLNSMVVAAWRLHRLWHLERAGLDGAVRRQLDPQFESMDYSERVHFAMMSGPDRCIQQESRLLRHFLTSLDKLLKLQGKDPKDRPKTIFPPVEPSFGPPKC